MKPFFLIIFCLLLNACGLNPTEKTDYTTTENKLKYAVWQTLIEQDFIKNHFQNCDKLYEISTHWGSSCAEYSITNWLCEEHEQEFNDKKIAKQASFTLTKTFTACQEDEFPNITGAVSYDVVSTYFYPNLSILAGEAATHYSISSSNLKVDALALNFNDVSVEFSQSAEYSCQGEILAGMDLKCEMVDKCDCIVSNL